MQKITVAAVSTRNLFGQVDAAFENMRGWVETAAQQGAELILFPELNVTGYFLNPIMYQFAEEIPGPSTERAIRLAGEMGVTLACGLLEREGEKYYCTHILVNGSGLIGKQRKIHTPVQEQRIWGLGDAINVFDIGKAKVGISVCRDSFFDEMTRSLYFKGAEIMLMPFGYYNVPRAKYLKETIHGMCMYKAAWTNGCFLMVCNSAENRPPSEIEPNGAKFPGWAGGFDPWGNVLSFVDREGNDEAMAIMEFDPAVMKDRREHPNFLAGELRPELYQWS